MKSLRHAALVVALGTACAMPVFAQTTSSSSTPSTSAQTPATRSVGAGAEDLHRDKDRDYGWIGLLGLAGLLGLRRKHDDRRDDYNRASTTPR